MTKNAQQALKYLLQSSNFNVRFFLICNYISKIDESLKNEFVCVRFNQLPQKDINKFIQQIAENENLNIRENAFHTIQKIYKSDIRSMINFIQLNQNIHDWEAIVLNDFVWEKIHEMFLQKQSMEEKMKNMIEYIHSLSIQYNVDKKNIMKDYFHYIIRTKKNLISCEFLKIVQVIMHSTDSNISNIITYFIVAMTDLLDP
jgi:replication factor C subunit 3/5